MKAVDSQDWDPAVKALTQFPTVLDTLAKNLAWTSTLGEAATTQQSDVMAAIQRMRAKAQAAGNLKSSSQIEVVQQAPQTIVIQPANPQVVYVPTYNPAVIYGAPIVTPGYSFGDLAAAAIISFGAGIAIGAMINNNNYCCGWGWSSWNTNWHSHTVIYQRNVYRGNPYWREAVVGIRDIARLSVYGRPPYYRPPGGRPPVPSADRGKPSTEWWAPPYTPGTPRRIRPPNRPGRPTIQPGVPQFKPVRVPELPAIVPAGRRFSQFPTSPARVRAGHAAAEHATGAAVIPRRRRPSPGSRLNAFKSADPRPVPATTKAWQY